MKRDNNLVERYRELRHEVELCLKGLPTSFGEILQKHDTHKNEAGCTTSKKHKISVKDYEWECGDGCCTELGREFYIDGEFVFRGSCEDDGWMAVLKKLGIDAELEGLNEQGETIWTL